MVLIVVLTALIGLGLYIRLAPSDPTQWHAMPDAMEDKDMAGGVMRVVEGGPELFERLHQIVVATPRTVVLTGSPQEQMVTYVTRTRVIGFPDYTTVRLVDTKIEIHARLRFGKSDLGVNAARVEGWLSQLAQ